MKKNLHPLWLATAAAMMCFPFDASADNYPTTSYRLSADGLTLTKWTGEETVIDMNSDDILRNVTTIGDYACSSLDVEMFVVGDNVTAINRNAFVDCLQLSELSLPEGLLSLGNAAFSTCQALTSVNLPSTLKTLGTSTFYGCASLNGITLPAGIEELPPYCFSGCTALTTITLHEGIKSIEEEAFKDCVSLTSITCPSTLRTIGAAAFTECTALASITFNAGLDEINGYAFDGCGLEAVDMSVITAPITIGFNAFQNCDKIRTALLPPNAFSISSGMFNNCTSLEEIAIPDTYDEVPVKLCNGCSGLKKLTLGTNVTTIKNTSFFECTSLEEIVFNDRLETIEWNVFYGCSSLKEVAFPASFKIADDYLFADCTSLSHVTCAAVVPPTLGVYSFLNVNTADATLSVPAESIEAYKAADQWKEFGIISDVASIGDVNAAVSTVGGAQVFDLQGRMLKSLTGESFSTVNDLDATLRSTLPAGIYIVRTSSEIRKVAVK